MSTILFANNASSTLANNINNSTTTVALSTGGGALFPNPSGGQYFLITITPVSTGIPGEIMQVTARSGDTLTVVRGQEGTTPTAYLAGDIVANLITAGTMSAFIQSATTNPSRIVTTSGAFSMTTADLNGSIGLNRTSGVGVSSATLPTGAATGTYKIVDLASNFNAFPVTISYPNTGGGLQLGPGGATTAVLNVNKSQTVFEYFGGSTQAWSGP